MVAAAGVRVVLARVSRERGNEGALIFSYRASPSPSPHRRGGRVVSVGNGMRLSVLTLVPPLMIGGDGRPGAGHGRDEEREKTREQKRE